MPALSAWNRYLESHGFKMAYMFRKNQAESDSVPPTQGALYEAILALTTRWKFGTIIKCAVLACHSQMNSDERKARMNGSPLWQKKHLLLNLSMWKGTNVSTLCIKPLLPVTWPCRGVANNYLLSKTSQNIETDCNLLQNSNKRSFFSRFIVQPRSHAGQHNALLLTPSKISLHAIQKCRQH